MASLVIAVEDSAGVRQGSGPITSATRFSQVRNLDRLGSFEFECAVNDPQAALLTERAVVRAYQGATEVGAGVVDRVETVVGNPTMLRVAGLDLGQELTNWAIIHLPLVKSGSPRAVGMFMLQIADSTGQATAAPVSAANACDGDAGTYYQYNTPGAQDSRPWIYLSAPKAFSRIDFTLSNPVAWANSAGRWQYFDGAAWATLTLTADTTKDGGGETLQQTGYVTFSIPGDWVPSTQDSGSYGYTIRLEAGWATERRMIETTVTPGDVPTDTALALITADWSAWSLDSTNGYTSTLKTDVYGNIECQNYVEALTTLAGLTGEHWRIGVGRKVVWLRKDTPASGLRAVGRAISLDSPLDPAVCLVKSLRRTRESYDCVASIYPYGAGLGDGRLDLRHATATPISGYALATRSGYVALKHTASYASGWLANTYRAVSFKDVGPTTSDQTAREYAANQLLDAATVWLSRRLAANYAYELGVAGVAQVIWPGQTIRVVYHEYADGVHTVNIDADLIVLSSTTETTAEGTQTVALTVSTIDAWPVSDEEVLLRLAKQAMAMGSYPQPVHVGAVNSQVFSTTGRSIGVGGGGLQEMLKG